LEEGGWYLHNAMRHEGVLYHPECHKDMEKVGQVDTSFNTTIEAINTTKKEVDGLEEQYGEILGKDKEDYVDPDVNIEAAAANDTEKVASPVKNMETEPLSLVADGAESGANSLSAPVVAQPKVEIKMKINSSMVPLERRESMMSSQSETEETEFDPDAITVPAPSADTLDSQKPRLKGKKFCVMPPRNLDSDLSGLCSIM